MQVVTKGEFARLINVSPGRVSQMIAEGKIDRAAMVGEGRLARIRVDLAKAQIAERTDIGQRFGNGLGTQLEFDAGERRASAETAPRPASDPVADAIKQERLRSLRLANEREAESRLAEQGRYVLADDALAGFTRVAAAMLNVFEGGLGDLATAFAAKFGLSQRDALHLARTEFRAIRARAAEQLRRESAGLPELLEDHVADASDPALGEA